MTTLLISDEDSNRDVRYPTAGSKVWRLLCDSIPNNQVWLLLPLCLAGMGGRGEGRTAGGRGPRMEKAGGEAKDKERRGGTDGYSPRRYVWLCMEWVYTRFLAL